MSGPYLSANGRNVTAIDLRVPWYGLAVADVVLASPVALTGAVSLVVGNLTLAMSVGRNPEGVEQSVSFAGETRARLVGGAGGWAVRVSLSPYRNPEGVRLSTVLADLARAAVNPVTGAAESVALAAGLDRSLGGFYVPESNALAGRLLATLANPLWWVDASGATQIATTRPTVTLAPQGAQVERYDGGKGWLTVATEDVKGWATPGATYTSATVPAGITVSAARVRSENDGVLRIEVLPS